MLAAVAWPTQEIFNPILTDALGLKDALAASGGASPSLLNGGLFQLEVLMAVFLPDLGRHFVREGVRPAPQLRIRVEGTRPDHSVGILHARPRRSLGSEYACGFCPFLPPLALAFPRSNQNVKLTS